MKIVLTGGPGAGKSTIASLLAARDPRFATIPEAASLVYGKHNARWDRIDDRRRREIQFEIYKTQCEQEAELLRAHPGKILLLDRGTIDGSVYWPDGAANYWQSLKTTAEAELARYDLAVWLETAAILGIYDGSASNPARHEDTATAVSLGMRVAEAWGAHPNLKRVSAYPSFEEKLAAAMTVIEAAIEQRKLTAE